MKALQMMIPTRTLSISEGADADAARGNVKDNKLMAEVEVAAEPVDTQVLASRRDVVEASNSISSSSHRSRIRGHMCLIVRRTLHSPIAE